MRTVRNTASCAYTDVLLRERKKEGMTEFIISTDLAKIQSQSIDANFDEMKAELTEMMTPYKSLVVTDMASAKDARAYCNKVRKSIDDARKTVKKMWISPYTAFEERCKELTAICDEASGAIDAQIKAVEEEERKLRVNTLRNYYLSCCNGVEEFLSFESIYNPKWETKSYGIQNAQNDIDKAVEKARGDLAVIRGMKSAHESSLLVEYGKTLDLGRVMLLAQKLDEMDRKKEEETQKEEESLEEEEPVAEEEPEQEAEEAEEEPTAVTEKLYTFTLEFTCTREQAFAIHDFFKSNNIKYRKVK